MPAILILIFFTLIQISLSKLHPVLRPVLLLIIPLYWFYFKNRIDFSLKVFANNRKILRIIIIVTLALTVFRIAHVTSRLIKPVNNMEDIALVEVKAIKAMFLEQQNPYSMKNLDPYSVDYSHEMRNFQGLKYPPLQLITYAPFTLLLGEKGIYVGNLLYYILVGITLFLLLRSVSLMHAYLGLICFLSTDFYFTLSFNKGINDFLPTLLLLWCWKEKANNKSGIYLGLSLLAKQLPGGLFLVLFALKKHWKSIGLALLIATLGVLPFLIADIKSFIDNTVIFNLIRPARETSLIAYLPAHVGKIISLIGIGLIAFMALSKLKIIRQNIWALPFLTILIFLLTSKMTPIHYFVWMIPFFILWLFSPEQKQEH